MNYAASILLLVFGLIAYQNFSKGTLGDWLGAKFANRAQPRPDTAGGPLAGLNTFVGAVTGWTVPVAGQITSSFGEPRGGGRSHEGLDIAAPTGTPISAAKAGVVSNVTSGGSCGLGVEIDHGLNIVTRYCHLSSVAVRVGDQVATGAPIGAVGATGDATGPHLHFEVRVRGGAVDPAGYLGLTSAPQPAPRKVK